MVICVSSWSIVSEVQRRDWRHFKVWLPVPSPLPHGKKVSRGRGPVFQIAKNHASCDFFFAVHTSTKKMSSHVIFFPVNASTRFCSTAPILTICGMLIFALCFEFYSRANFFNATAPKIGVNILLLHFFLRNSVMWSCLWLTESIFLFCIWPPFPGGGGGCHKALVVGSVSLWRRLLASRL